MPPKLLFEAQKIVEEGRTTRMAIQAIREWLSTTKYPKISDEQIVLFLLSCDNHISNTQKTIEAFYKCRQNSPEFFDDRDLDNEDVASATDVVDFMIMPKRSPTGNLIMMARLRDTRFWQFQATHSIKLLLMCVDLGLIDNPPTGLIFIIDMKGSSLMHVTRFGFTVLKKFFAYVQEALPIKLVTVYVINTTYFIDKFITLIKPFLKEELKQLLKIMPTGMTVAEFMDKYLAPDYMPEEYGGNLQSGERIKQITLAGLRQAKDFFDAEEKQRKSYLTRIK